MLRALAAILVVYTHAICSMDNYAMGWQQRLPARTALGGFGVDLFFVISGFVIYCSATRLSGRPAAGTFLWHRFRRINPLYYIATLLTIAAWYPAIHRGEHGPVTGNDLLSSFLLLHYPGAANPVLVQAWSLYFEWYFYLVFSLLILLKIKNKAATLTIVLGGLTIVGGIFGFRRLDFLGFYMDPFILEFLMGVGVGFCFQRWTPGKPVALGLLIPGILLSLVWIGTGYPDHDISPWLQTTSSKFIHSFGWGGSAALIVAGCAFLEKNGAAASFHRHRLILLLGDASYSIYIFHFLVLGAIGAFWLRFKFFLPADLAIHIHALVMVAGSLLFYKWVEQPLLKILRKDPSPRPIPSPPAAP